MDQSLLNAPVIGVSGAGRRTLTALLELSHPLPGQLRVCVLDASRLDAPELISLLDRLAAKPELRPIFVLNKADLPVSVRSAMTRTLALLRERGFAQPEIYPLCAEAARLFLLPTLGRELSSDDQAALARAYDRYGPGENSLSGYAVTGDLRCTVGGRDVSPEQLRLALENTGLPALRARLEELCADGAALPAAAAAAPKAQEPMPEKAPAPEVPEPEAEAEALPLPAPTAPLEEWFAAIGRTGFDELPALEGTLRRLPVNEEQSAALLGALSQRRHALLEQRMARLIAPAGSEDCAGLLRLAQQIRQSDYPDDIREKALQALHTQYQARELTELRELTLDADTLDIPALQELTERLSAGPYTAQTRAPYLELLRGRVEELHREALSEICRGVDEADPPALDQMRAQICARECPDELKAPFLDAVARREDALDLGQLEALTADAASMRVAELDALAATLEGSDWNPKYVARFRQKIALCREAAVYREVQEETADLGVMERGEVLELQQKLREKDLPGRFTAEPLARADERLCRLDMLRLMALGNDFNSMDFQQIDELRLRAMQGDYHEKARADYLARLQARERALVYANASGRAALVQQLAAQHRVKLSDLNISATDPAYDEALRRFWGGSGLEQPRDIPVFLLNNASTLAISGSRFWYKSGKSLAFLPLEEVERVQGFKQKLSLSLQIVRKDNSYLLTEAKLHRINASAVLDFLNECLRRWQERAVPEGTLPPAERVAPFLPVAYTAPPEVRPLNEQTVLQAMQRQYAAAKLTYGSLRGDDDALWESRSAKVLQGFELSARTRLVWYCSASLLGSNKEGVAVGPDGLYVKQARQAVRAIPIDEISDLRKAGSKRLEAVTASGEAVPLDVPASMEAVLRDYIRGIQLARCLRQAPQPERGREEAAQQ